MGGVTRRAGSRDGVTIAWGLQRPGGLPAPCNWRHSQSWSRSPFLVGYPGLGQTKEYEVDGIVTREGVSVQ